ncbi:DUF192 domain-containing protein [Roseofilum sp. BLCC_M114]|uniref:DUF192 domain-containing protein n=1 Tax=Roseofilum capinflatum BLCC-M114 TaxID=3022440 RepID=A0ABT7BDG3_9CYAN|nr:DUF192 domain-containing protein [Roseofilum capinflatum]MDJ1177224.1 DUF192 domain-containing protein [Roseofilum capinflatum BLCC-M114]
MNGIVLGLALLLSLGTIGCARSTPPPASVDRIAQENPKGQQLEVSAQVEISGEPIDLEVARTPEQQALGLMYRPELPDNRGMLFPFSSPRILTFWMKNVPVPLDMVFLLDGEVKAIAASVPPCTTPSCPVYGPNEPVNQVIELRSGRAAELGLQVGDRLEIQFLDSP